MFRAIVTSTPLTTGEANTYFSNITGVAYHGDSTFLSTLRALIAPRIGEGESINLHFSNTTYRKAHIEDSSNSTKVLVRAVFNPEDWRDGTLFINELIGNDTDTSAWFELIENKFTEIYPEFHRIERVTDFFRKVFGVLCFVDPDTKKVFICVKDANTKRMHYLQCGILAFLPWYFNKEDGVTELERELIESLRMTTAEKYLECIGKIAGQYDFETEQVKRLLAGFETKFERRRIETVESEIQDILREIQDLNEMIHSKLKRKRDAEITVLGLQEKIRKTSDESEIMEYFLRNRRLHLNYVRGEEIGFGVKDYLTYFDEDMAESVINNDDSYVYYPGGLDGNRYIPHDDMKRLMTAIFLDETVKVKMCALYEFSPEGYVHGISHGDYDYKYGDATPNPHIDAYRCLGNYETAINELLTRYDYISAIEQCVASCKSLNFGDSTVMKEFMYRIYGRSDDSVNMKCIELPDGTMATPKEAIKYLKKEENQNG